MAATDTPQNDENAGLLNAIGAWLHNARLLLFWFSVLIVLSILLILAGYLVVPEYSGFATKKWWDWLELLASPVFIAIGGYLISSVVKQADERRAKQEKEREQARAQQEKERDTLRARHESMDKVLESYLDDMSELLITGNLQAALDASSGEHGSEEKEVPPVVVVARARTVAALRSLDAQRRTLVMHFLQEAKLVTGEKGTLLSEVYLAWSDLEDTVFSNVNLYLTNLFGAKLSDAYLPNANLSYSPLQTANLTRAILREANLTHAFLHRTNLTRADLWNADLQDAEIKDADLHGANLKGANLRNLRDWTLEQLASAASLEGATMPDGTIFNEEWAAKLKAALDDEKKSDKADRSAGMIQQ